MRRIVALLALLCLPHARAASRSSSCCPIPTAARARSRSTTARSRCCSTSPMRPARCAEAPPQPVTVDQAQVQQIFGNALAAQPILPSHFVLYFDQRQRHADARIRSASTRPCSRTSSAARSMRSRSSAIPTRSATQRYNQQLSHEPRRDDPRRLVHDGISPKSISVAGRGQLDLAVKTGDQVSEPRNRRVEITVR